MSATVLTSKYSEVPLHIRATSVLLSSTADKPSKIPNASHIPDSVSSSPNMSDTNSPRKRQRVDRSAPSPIPEPSSSIRRSERRKEKHHPLGPRHLEYDYHQAHEELRAATIRAVYEMGYKPSKKALNGPSTRSKSNPSSSRLPTVADIVAAGFPYLLQARRKLNRADRLLQEAISNGQYWDNTPIPPFEGILDSPPTVPSFLPSLPEDDASTDSSYTCSYAPTRSASPRFSIGATTTAESTPEPETLKVSVKLSSRKRRRED